MGYPFEDMPTIDLNKYLFAIAVLACIAIAGAVGLGIYVSSGFSKVEETWTQYAEDADNITVSLWRLERDMGYGGFIHNYKNYVLRRDARYLNALRQNLAAAQAELSNLRQRLNEPSDLQAMADIEGTLNDYVTRLEEARKQEALSTALLDEAVRTSDFRALSALDILQKNARERLALKRMQSDELVAGLYTRMLLGGLVVGVLAVGLAALVLLTRRLIDGTRDLENSYQISDAVFKEARDPQLMMDREGIVVRANTAASFFFGYLVAELVGMNIKALLDFEGEGPDDAWPDDGWTVDNWTSDGAPTYAVTKSNLRMPADASVKPVGSIGDQLYLATIRDMSEYVETTTALKEASMRAISESEAKSMFLAGLSRELRTALDDVLAILPLMDGKGEDDAERVMMPDAAKSGLHLLRVLNQLFDLSLRKAGDVQVSIQNVGLGDIKAELTSVFETQTKLKNIDLIFEFSESPWQRIFVDYRHLLQILKNIVGNAVEYTTHGSVTVNCSVRPSADIDHLIIDVADTGPGIPDEIGKAVFAPPDENTNRSLHDGVGLRLSIAKSIAVHLNASLDMVSNTPHGTLIRLDLPVEVAMGDAPSQGFIDRFKGTAPAGSRSVLVVDDDEVHGLVTTSMLKLMGHQAFHSSSGLDAIDKLVAISNPFDLVLMKIDMPGMDGVETTRKIREFGYTSQSLPIVALTAHNAPHKAETYLASGLQAVLSKPLTKDALRSILDQVDVGFEDGSELVSDLDITTTETGVTETRTATETNAATETKAAPTMADLPDFDEKLINDIQTALKPDQVKELYERLRRETVRLIGALRNSLQDEKAMAVYRHELKGLLGSFGLSGAAQNCSDLNAADGGSVEELSARLDTLSTRIDADVDVLYAKLASKPATDEDASIPDETAI